MSISIVVAMAKNRVIGFKGRMPWHLPAELAHFKKITLGKPVLMGRRTFESIGRPLPARRNLILSRQSGLKLPGCEIYASLEAALSAIAPSEELMVIGGGELFREALPLAQRLYLTFIEAEVEGDTFFPTWQPNEWQEVHSKYFPADNKNPCAFRTVELTRK